MTKGGFTKQLSSKFNAYVIRGCVRVVGSRVTDQEVACFTVIWEIGDMLFLCLEQV